MFGKVSIPVINQQHFGIHHYCFGYENCAAFPQLFWVIDAKTAKLYAAINLGIRIMDPRKIGWGGL